MEKKHRRNSLRLQGFDYATEGAYFITICCKDRRHFFGQVKAGSMSLSALGELARQAWLETEQMWERVRFDEWMIMPNHMHALVWFTDQGQLHPPRYQALPQTPGYENRLLAPVGNLSALVRGFKGAVTRAARAQGFADFGWQRSFHDRVMRDQDEIATVRAYIQNNPAKWEEDDLFG